MSQGNKNNLFKKVYRIPTLEKAWRKVQSNGFQSNSYKTKKEIIEFSKNAPKSLRKIKDKLKSKDFKFLANAILLDKAKSKKRPLTNFTIESRIVNRAILDILQSHENIKKKYLAIETSFGGIGEKSVEEAIKCLESKLGNGANYFIKSDIKEFFTSVPINTVIDFLKEDINDINFLHLIKDALKVEVLNYESLGAYKQYYDFEQVGIPQGSSLSPLIANILLREFDVEMNNDDSSCLRFLDDFIIISPSQKKANGVFKKAQKLLSKYNLSAYDPKVDQKKAHQGHTKSKIPFLGIIYDNGIKRPSDKSLNSQYQSINNILNKCRRVDFSTYNSKTHKYSVVETLDMIDNKLKGWANGYKFCNDIEYREKFDAKINKSLSSFYRIINKRTKKYSSNNELDKLRRFIGVFLVKDSLQLIS